MGKTYRMNGGNEKHTQNLIGKPERKGTTQVGCGVTCRGE
jgi:hypothetical protein